MSEFSVCRCCTTYVIASGHAAVPGRESRTVNPILIRDVFNSRVSVTCLATKGGGFICEMHNLEKNHIYNDVMTLTWLLTDN